MAVSDIRILDIQCSFSTEMFRIPLRLSSGPISASTYAMAKITVENRQGSQAVGSGGVFLSDLWAFPTPLIPSEDKVRAMKSLMEKLRRNLADIDGYWDGLQLGHMLTERLPAMLEELRRDHQLPAAVPQLAGLVCSAPFDAAVHDAWGRASGMSTYEMYNKHFLNADLSPYLGDSWEGQYPGDYLIRPDPAARLQVQHVVGAGDPLTAGDVDPGGRPNDGLPYTLEEWIEVDRVHAFKLKTKGTDARTNIDFIRGVYAVATEAGRRSGIRDRIRLSLDPNEAYADPAPLVELLDRLRLDDPDVYQALDYIEQPTPRDLSAYRYTLHEAAARKPVIIDESLEDMNNLSFIETLGWSGMAIKTCKGHSHALTAYCWARRNRLYVTVQDLTNVGMAHVQSAHLFSRLALSVDVLEFNSRQYAPFSRMDEKQLYPALFTVSNGTVSLRDLEEIGLY